MSTFQTLRAGKKGYLAGSAKLVLAVDASATGSVGFLPVGAVVLGANASEDAVAATVGAVTLTTVTAGDAISVDPIVQDNPEIIVTVAAASAMLYVEYVLGDSRNGANS